MSVRLYVDVHVRRAITEGLRLRGVDVLTAQEDGARELDDSELLDRATALERVLFTQDDDLLREAKRRQQTGQTFTGVIHLYGIAYDNCQRWARTAAPSPESLQYIVPRLSPSLYRRPRRHRCNDKPSAKVSFGCS